MKPREILEKINFKLVGYLLGAVLFVLLLFYSYLEWDKKVERDISLAIDAVLLEEEKIKSDEIKGDLTKIRDDFLAIYEQNTSKINGIRALFLAASVELEQEEYDSSREKLQTIIEKSPNHFLAPKAYLTIAFIERNNKNYDEALRILEEFKENYPDHYLQEEVTLTQGKIYTELKDYELAKTFFDEIIVNSENPAIQENAQEKIDFLTVEELISGELKTNQ